MTLYKGFAQQRGFDPVNIPDPSGKIRQQGLVALGHMKDDIEWNNKQVGRLVSALRENNALEEQNRESNFKLRQSYRDMLAKARWNNYETAINNEKVKYENKQQAWKDIISMVPSGVKLIKKIDAENKKNIDAFARDTYDLYGIGKKKWDQIRAIDNHIWNHQTKLEGALAEMGLNGVPADVLQRIRSGGGYQKLRVAELTAQRLAQQLPSFYAQNWNTDVDIGGQKTNIGNANAEQIPEVLRLLRQQFREDYGESYPSAKIWDTSGAWKIAEQADVSIIKSKQAQEIKDAKKAEHHDELETLQHQISRFSETNVGQSGAMGIVSTIYHYAGGEDAPRERLVSARSRVVNAVSQGLKDGTLTWDQVKGLETLEINVRGQKKPVRWGDYFKREWHQIEQAGVAQVSAEYKAAALGEQRHKNADQKMKSDMIEMFSEGEPNLEVIGRFMNTAKSSRYTQTYNYLAARMAQGQGIENDEAGIGILRERQRLGQTVTDDEIDKLNLSKEVTALAKAEARKSNAKLPTLGKGGYAERLKNRIEEELEYIIPKSNQWSSQASRQDTEIQGFQQASIYYRTAIESGKNHAEAYEYAKKAITDDIKNQRGIFEKVWTKDGYEFKGGVVEPMKPGDYISIPRQQISNELNSNQGLIYSKPYIDKKYLVEKSAKLNKGYNQDPLEQAKLVSSLTKNKISSLSAEMAQLEYYRKEEIKEKGSSDIQPYPKWYIERVKALEKPITPRQQFLLDTYNPVDVNKKYTLDGNAPPYIGSITDKVSSIAKKPYGGDYNSVGPGVTSQDTLNHPLTIATVREIMILQENGHIETAGAYGLSYDQIKAAVEAGEMSYDQKFTPDTQDRLFEALYRSGGWTGVPEDDKDQLILNDVQQNSGKNELGKLSYHSPRLVNSTALAYLKSIGRFDEELNYAAA